MIYKDYIDFRSPLLTKSRLISIPSVTKMFQFTELIIIKKSSFLVRFF